jgi:hypothetical protein
LIALLTLTLPPQDERALNVRMGASGALPILEPPAMRLFYPAARSPGAISGRLARPGGARSRASAASYRSNEGGWAARR